MLTAGGTLLRADAGADTVVRGVPAELNNGTYACESGAGGGDKTGDSSAGEAPATVFDTACSGADAAAMLEAAVVVNVGPPEGAKRELQGA